MRVQMLVLLLLLLVVPGHFLAEPSGENTSGSLRILGKDSGFCPLRHTDVKAGISGFVARVTVTQSFQNPSSTPIEAVYTFPLPHEASVDDMTIHIGDRTIRGVIKTREEAARIYAKAIQRGQTAALLDQERPNIFTQSVGNIPPGANIEVVISYVQTLAYEDGQYDFTFPMVVGPRYVPGNMAIGHAGDGFSPDTDRVPDASKTTPPIARTRAGHDISLAVALDAGIAIKAIASPSHPIDVQKITPTSALVKLGNDATIPNKDFILRYKISAPQIEESLLTHTENRFGGYFSLIVQPPERFPESDVTPKELVFVLDSSGSMNGFPEQKAKQFIDTALNGLYPGDTFNVIKFSGDTAVLFPEPVYPSALNVQKAREFVDAQWGGSGTEMMKAINAALDPSDSKDHVRIVVFLTDGYVGNDFEILGEIKKHPNARVFAYGIGSSVNRFLIAGMGRVGRGESEVISEQINPEEADAAAHRLYEHLRSPLLTDVRIDFGSLPVRDVHPVQSPDLYAGKPIVITGRYTGPAKGNVRLIAKRAGDAYAREIPVQFPVTNADNSVLPNVWARFKIEDLMSQDWGGLQRQQMTPELQKEITRLGLEYGLMTQFTAFVAVEEKVANVEGKPQRIQVPIELPQGVQMEDGWAEGDARSTRMVSVNGAMTSSLVTNGAIGGPLMLKQAVVPPPTALPSFQTGIGSGSGGGIGVGTSAIRGPSAGPVLTIYNGSPETRLLVSKVSPELLADYLCWQRLADKTNSTSCRLATNMVNVEIVSTKEIPARELSSAGFQRGSQQSSKNRLRGTIAIDKLPDLAALEDVQLITKARSEK